GTAASSGGDLGSSGRQFGRDAGARHHRAIPGFSHSDRCHRERHRSMGARSTFAHDAKAPAGPEAFSGAAVSEDLAEGWAWVTIANLAPIAFFLPTSWEVFAFAG